MIAILRHELSSYFHSFTAYVFGAFLLVAVGIGAMLFNIQAAVANFEYVLSFVNMILVVIVPILTMRVIAEEKKQKTDQLLYSFDESYYYNDEEIEIDDFKNALEALTADIFTDEQPAQKEKIALTLHLNNENYPQITIILYRYDGSYCLAEVDGETVSLVERSYVVDLIETVNAIVLNE